MNNHTNGNYRYPGSQPFSGSDAHRLLFFGREEETQLLLHQILTSRLVVLYAKSGLGKTSLINAGLSHALRDKGFIPLPVRFYKRKSNLLETFYEGIQENVKSKEKNYEEGKKDYMWEFFKTAAFWGEKDRLLKPVVILDQFEEFFSLHSSKSRKEFTLQLADLVNNTIPAGLTDSMPPEKPFPYSEKPPNVKIIISLREDYLGHLDEMSDYIPNILHKRFRLMPLDLKQARQAIKKPLEVQDKAIQANSFKFSTEAVNIMLKYLCKQKGGVGKSERVESFQLQLLCRHMEDKARQKRGKGKDEVIIGKDDLEGESGMQSVLEEFYNNQLNRLGSKDQQKVMRLCEEGLISIFDRRLSMEQDEIKLNYNVSKELLDKLVEMRLLRREPWVGSSYYELSHDTLVEPIRKSQKKRALKGKPVEKLLEEARELKDSLEFDEAAEKYKDILDIDSTHVNAYLELGQVYYDEKKYGKSEKIYNEAIDNRIKNALIYYWLGQTLFTARHKMKKAIKSYRESLKLDPRLYMAYEGLGDVYEYRDEFKKAEANYEDALEINKKKTGIYIKLAKLYIRKGESERVVPIFKRAIEASRDYADIYYDIAEALKGVKKWDLVEKISELASESGSEHALHYYCLGYNYAELKKYDRAIDNYKKTVDIDPSHADAYHNMGNVYFELKQYNEAIETYTKAIEINPDDETSHFMKGNAYFQLKKYDDAIKAYKEAIKINPYDAVFFNNMANAYCQLKRYNDAIREYKKVIEIDTEHIAARASLAEVYLIAGSFYSADTHAKELLKEKNIPVEYILAMRFISLTSYLFRGKQRQAIMRLKKLIDYYKTIEQDYERTRSYDFLKEFIKSSKRLSPLPPLLLRIIELLESPLEKGLQRVDELTASIPASVPS